MLISKERLVRYWKLSYADWLGFSIYGFLTTTESRYGPICEKFFDLFSLPLPKNSAVFFRSLQKYEHIKNKIVVWLYKVSMNVNLANANRALAIVAAGASANLSYALEFLSFRNPCKESGSDVWLWICITLNISLSELSWHFLLYSYARICFSAYLRSWDTEHTVLKI